MATPFNLKEISSLLEMLEKHEVTEFKLERGEERLWLKRGEEDARESAPAAAPTVSHYVTQYPQAMPQQVQMSAPPPQAAPQGVPASHGSSAATSQAPGQEVQVAEVPAVAANLREVSSPMVGTFYRRPAVDAEPYVEIGDRVKKGDVLCIVEAMKLMNEIESEITGTVKEVCLDDGQMIEYGEVMFRIEPQ